MTKEQPGTWGKNKSTKDDVLEVGTSTPFPSPPTRLPHPSLLSAWARREGSPPCAVPAPRAKPLGTRKPLQTMPWSLGIIDGVFTTSKRPVPGQTVKGNTSGPLGYRRL